MQYKSITFTRTICPKPYESKKLEITVELSENDEPALIADKVMREVEYLLRQAPDAIDGERFVITSDDLKKDEIPW